MYKIPYKFIAIEGNIGAGKTTLATAISNELNSKLLLERFEENPFLKDFYKDRDKYALETEQFFLNDRIQQLSDFFNEQNTLTISDFSIYKSIIFSNLTLDESNRMLFKQKFEESIHSIMKPDLIIHLRNDPNEVKKRIINRGRAYEQSIELKYLIDLENEYEAYWKSESGLNVLQINLAGINFPYQLKDILHLLGYLEATEIKGFKKMNAKDLE